MKDQEKQALEGFQGNYREFRISLRLTTGEESVELIVENTQTLYRYRQIIDHQYIANQQDFKNIFEEPFDIFDYLIHHFQDVVVEQDTLKFPYIFGNIRKKVKNIVIQIVKQEIDPVQFAQLKMVKMKESFAVQLTLKQLSIQMLQEKLKSIEEENKELKQSLKIQNAKNAQLRKIQHLNVGQKEEMMAKLSDENTKLKEIIQKSQETITKLNLSLKQAQDKNKEMVLQLQDLRKISSRQKLTKVVSLSKIQLKTQPKYQNYIAHHPHNSHKTFYTLKNKTGALASIINTGEDADYNFVNQCEILPNQKVKYSVKINKSKFCNLMIGFCTEKGLGNFCNFNHSESVYYYCQGAGYLYEGGSRRNLTVGSTAGDVVECIADLINAKFIWLKQGNQFAACSIPSQMKNKALHFSAILHYSGDCIDISV